MRLPMILLAFPLLLTPVARGQPRIELGMRPLRFEAAIGPGLDWTGAALVTNGGAAPGRIRAEALDFALDGDGQPVFGDLASERRWSCRDWLVMNPWEARLGAGASALARLTVRVPDGTTEGGYHCAAAYRLEPPAPAPGVGLRAAVRVAAAVYVVVGDPPVAELAVTELALERDGGGACAGIAVTFLNTGRRHYRAAGAVRVVDAAGETVAELAVPRRPVLPGRRQRFTLRWPAELDPRAEYGLRFDPAAEPGQ